MSPMARIILVKENTKKKEDYESSSSKGGLLEPHKQDLLTTLNENGERIPS
jgi:hypothetical protein